jgi:hypothetical protein
MNAKHFVIVIVILALLILPLFLRGEADKRQLLFRTPNNNRLYYIDVQTNEEKILYECEEDSWLHDFKVSPTGKLVGVMKTKRGITPPGEHDFSVPPKNSLVFIDPDHAEITILDEDVRKFSWSPDGEKIAYIAGTYYEGGVGFMTTGVGIFDLRDHSKTQIKKDFPHQMVKTASGELFEGGGIEINWPRHDSNVYIQDFGYLDGIYRYNTKTGKSEKVEYKGIDFSPDGKYYKEIVVGEGEAGINVYKTATNEDITSQLISRFGPEWSLVSLSWVFDKGHCLHVVNHSLERVKIGKFSSGKDKWGNPVKHNVLYDVEEDRVVKEVTLPVSRWTASPDKLVFEEDGKFVVWTYEDVYKE